VVAFERLIDGLGRGNDAVLVLCRYAVIGLVAVIAVMLAAGVFYRYVLNDALAWSEEAAKYLMVWLTFTGAPIALRHGGHVNIDILLRIVPARVQQVLHLVIFAIVAAVMLILLGYGFKMALLGLRQVASSFHLSMVYMYAAVPVGSLIMLSLSVELMLRAALGLVDPERGVRLDQQALVEEVRQ